MTPDTEHPATEGDICGATVQGENIEWICIKEPHQPVYTRKSTDAHHQGVFDTSGQHPERAPFVQRAPWEAHYFVNRWPYRPIRKEE